MTDDDNHKYAEEVISWTIDRTTYHTGEKILRDQTVPALIVPTATYETLISALRLALSVTGNGVLAYGDQGNRIYVADVLRTALAAVDKE